MKYSIDFLKLAHKGSIASKEEIVNGEFCGCFDCRHVYPAKEIIEWVKETIGETAVCPKCGTDAVLSEKWPINDETFLKEMNEYWCSYNEN